MPYNIIRIMWIISLYETRRKGF